MYLKKLMIESWFFIVYSKILYYSNSNYENLISLELLFCINFITFLQYWFRFINLDSSILFCLYDCFFLVICLLIYFLGFPYDTLIINFNGINYCAAYILILLILFLIDIYYYFDVLLVYVWIMLRELI